MGSHSQVMEGIGCSIEQSKCCNASFAPFSCLKTEDIKKGKILGVKVKVDIKKSKS